VDLLLDCNIFRYKYRICWMMMHQPMCYYRNIYSDVFEVNINMIKVNVENKADTEYVLNSHTHRTKQELDYGGV